MKIACRLHTGSSALSAFLQYHSYTADEVDVPPTGDLDALEIFEDAPAYLAVGCAQMLVARPASVPHHESFIVEYSFEIALMPVFRAVPEAELPALVSSRISLRIASRSSFLLRRLQLDRERTAFAEQRVDSRDEPARPTAVSMHSDAASQGGCRRVWRRREWAYMSPRQLRRARLREERLLRGRSARPTIAPSRSAGDSIGARRGAEDGSAGALL